MLTKQELRQLQGKELQEELAKTSRDLMKTKLEHASKTLKETHLLRGLRRYLSRMKTIVRENEIGAASNKSTK
jgi:ribosomal protein L29